MKRRFRALQKDGAPGFRAMNASALPAIGTPCIKVCVIDPETGFCIGCGRAGMEIARRGAE